MVGQRRRRYDGDDDSKNAVNVLVIVALVIHSCRVSVAFFNEVKVEKQNKTMELKTNTNSNTHTYINWLWECELTTRKATEQKYKNKLLGFGLFV